MQRDDAYLLDMLLAARRVARYTSGLTREAFAGDDIRQDAVMRQLQIIGEAARALSPALRDSHPEISWQGIIGLRHRLVHHYFRIELERIWRVVEEHVPVLISQLERLVAPDEPQEEVSGGNNLPK
ncbi:MAG: DUF86 domain-containing protein [Armatimonadetes bacterium]|nr:DUF86 domain-containing protein [Armatimonadota bacterium]